MNQDNVWVLLIQTTLLKHSFMFCWHASRYIRAMKTDLMQCLPLVYFVNQSLHVSGISVAHHQEVYCIYTTISTCCAMQLIVGRLANGQQTANWRAQHVPIVVYIQGYSKWLSGCWQLPPRSPDATPCDFFLWGYVKDQIYVPPLPASIPELKVRIRTAIETITADMLQTVFLLNNKRHILLSPVYCVWQVVKTPTIISNNPVN